MRTLFLSLLMIALLASTLALAEKPTTELPQRYRLPCGLNTVTFDWNFAQGDQGFTTAVCEPEGLPAWEYGNETTIPGSPGMVWGTVLNGSYASNTGDGLISPSFLVEVGTEMVEIHHYYDIETNYDGGNLTVNGVVVPPMVGYDGVISESANYYAYCLDLEDGFTGHDNLWRTDCFDLSDFMGQTVTLEFDFGTDSSVTYPGWYIAWIKVGSLVVIEEGHSWGHIKGLYR